MGLRGRHLTASGVDQHLSIRRSARFDSADVYVCRPLVGWHSSYDSCERGGCEHELSMPGTGKSTARKKAPMSRLDETQHTSVDAAWRRLLRLFNRGRRKGGRLHRLKPAAKKTPNRKWVKLRGALKLWLRWRKPKSPGRHLWLQRELRKWWRRLTAFHATLSGWRYWLMIGAAVALVIGSSFVGYKLWQHEQIRKETLATVNAKPITRSDLAAEVIATGVDFRQLGAAARKQLLDRIIERRLLVDIASKQGITKDARSAAMRARADEMFLANLVLQRFAGNAPPPASDEEARRFMVAHPGAFAERQTFIVDGFNCLLASIPTNAQVVFATMDTADRFLQESKAPHQRSLQALDSADLPAAAIAMLMKMKPGDVFVMPRGRATLIGTVKNRVPSNVPPEIQLEIAREVLKKQQTEKRLQAAVGELRSKAAIEYSAQ